MFLAVCSYAGKKDGTERYISMLSYCEEKRRRNIYDFFSSMYKNMCEYALMYCNEDLINRRLI